MNCNNGSELKYICMQINLLTMVIDKTLLIGFIFNYCSVKRIRMIFSDIFLYYNIFVKDYDKNHLSYFTIF